MDLVEELIIPEADPRIKVDSTSQILNNNNQTTKPPGILKKTCNLSHADGLTLDGNMFNAILQKLNSSAAQTESTLSDLRMERGKRDLTCLLVLENLCLMILNSKPHTVDSSILESKSP
jgi:hypothetical protein